MVDIILRFVRSESGLVEIETGLLSALVGVGTITGLQVLQTQLDGAMNALSTKLMAATTRL